MKKALRILGSLALALSLAACAGNDNATFNGSRTSDEHHFEMQYSILNSSDSHTLELKEGDAISVEIVSDAGELAVVIQKEGADPVYEGHQLPTSAFQVTVHEGGAYTITVTGKKAKGSVSFVKSAAE